MENRKQQDTSQGMGLQTPAFLAASLIPQESSTAAKASAHSNTIHGILP